MALQPKNTHGIAIASGELKGLRLKTPTGNTTRPTPVKVRQAVFNKLAFQMPSYATGLDLFAGTGAMGIEMLSHGLSCVDFVENSPVAFKTLQLNLAAVVNRLNRQHSCRSHKFEALEFVHQQISAKIVYDLIWADPPYAQAVEFIKNASSALFQLLADGGIFVCESDESDLERVREELRQNGFAVEQKSYGDTGVTYACQRKL